MSFSTLPSTNRFAIQLVSKTRPRAGTVITATHQTAGEGQFGRSWYASKGKNLSLSAIIYPDIPAQKQFFLSASTALAVRETVSRALNHSAPVFIKWPNDILVQSNKVGGILIQNTLKGASITSTIMGIGLNVNEQQFPPGIGDPVSLSQLSGGYLNIATIQRCLLGSLKTSFKRLTDHAFDEIMQAYHKHLYCIGKESAFTFAESHSTVNATVIGVDESGKLILEQAGETTAYSLQEARFAL